MHLPARTPLASHSATCGSSLLKFVFFHERALPLLRGVGVIGLLLQTRQHGFDVRPQGTGRWRQDIQRFGQGGSSGGGVADGVLNHRQDLKVRGRSAMGPFHSALGIRQRGDRVAKFHCRAKG